jgi:prophage antirepressor-like protein
MQSIQVFNNGISEVRTHIFNDIPYFNAKDVAKCLEYKDTTKAITQNVFEEDRVRLADIKGWVTGPPLLKNEQGHSVYITEAGVWCLVCGGKSKPAQEFKRWLCGEILPKLRRGYLQDQLRTLALKNEADLHHLVVRSIRRFWPHALLVTGELQQDTPERRIQAYRCGYQVGTPDLLILSPAHKLFNGFAIELKSPKGTGKASNSQVNLLENYRLSGFQTLMTDDYSVCLHALCEYFADTRLTCSLCSRKYKNQDTLNRHMSKFHKCCD